MNAPAGLIRLADCLHAHAGPGDRVPFLFQAAAGIKGLAGRVRQPAIRNLSRGPLNGRISMLWRVSRPLRSRSKPEGFILSCQPALADRPPSGPGWLHEIKFDGYRVIARKDGDRVRLWARTTSDYSKAFTRIRDAVAALPVESAVLDGEAIVMRSADPVRFRGAEIAPRPGRGDPGGLRHHGGGRPGRAP